MCTHKHPVASWQIRSALEVCWKLGLLLLLLSTLSLSSLAQPALVLPGDGKSAQEVAPQGGLRFQRHMYLITAEEMQQTEFNAGLMINGIGFTLAAAQSDTTRGQLKVYLQNTSDLVSRRDTQWTFLSSTGNSLSLADLVSGQYEWQMQTVCSGDSSAFSGSLTFETADPETCNAASNLQVSQITTSSALLEWSAPLSNNFTEYLVEYSIAGSGIWTSTSTTESQLDITGLASDTIYQWRVQTHCSNATAPLINASFSTLAEGNCAAPTSLASESTGDDQAVLRWAAATDATRYDIQYRVVGASAWLFGISFSDSLLLTSLLSGNTYEWRVRTVCPEGLGNYQNGPNFTTSGTAPCLPPANRSTTVLTDTSAILSWSSAAGGTSYVIRYRLKDAISWTNVVQPMVLVHNAEVVLPDTIGDFHIPFQGDGISAFSYTGEGVYVAWEYTNAANPTASPNNVLATTANTRVIGSFGQDSLQRVLSLVAPNEVEATEHEELLFATSLRPATFFSSSDLNDVVSVEVIHALGHVAPPFSSPSPITAVVKNHSAEAVNTEITLMVKAQENGSLRFSNTQTISLAPNSTSSIAFDIWEPTELGQDTLWVNIPGQANESILSNNQTFLVQNVTQAKIGYADQSPAVTNTGFGEDGGLILVRLPMNGCGRVNATEVFLDASATNQPLYAVVLDGNGNRVDSSAVFIPDSTEVDNAHSFYFPNQPFFQNSFYYVGLAQETSPSPSVFPVGVQWETANIQDSAYFRAKLDGSDLRQVSLPGRLMITAEVVPTDLTPWIVGASTVCPGNPATLTVGQQSERFANQVLRVSSAFGNIAFNEDQILGSPSLFPAGGPEAGQWIPQSADDQREYIELSFPAAAPINYVTVYETFNPGAIDTIYARNPNTGVFEVVYMATAAPSASPTQVLEVEFPLTSFAVEEIRLAMASNSIPGFNGIDAIAIGQRQTTSSFASYNWSTGDTSPSITITSPGQYAVSVSDGNACQLSTSQQVDDPNQNRPGITVLNEAETTFCAGESITLIASETENINWNTGDTTAMITVSESGIYFYTQAVEGGCGLVHSDSIAVTVHPLPQIALAPVSSICVGESRILDAGAGFASYQWSTGSIEQSITISTADAYTVTVTDANGCEASASTVAILTPTPNPQIQGDLAFCPGSSTTLQLTANFAQYSWSNGATTAAIQVESGGDYSVTVTDENACTGSTMATVIALDNPVPVITGNLSFCAGNTTTLDVGLGFATYLWSTGETSPSIIVDTVASFSVTVTDANGCTGSATATTSENGALPVSPGPIRGPSLGLCQTTNNVYTIDPVPNTTHYVWTVPEGDTIISGQGTTSITVNSNNLSNGYIVVAASNACGQSPSITPTELFVQGTPAPPGPINGPTAGLCNSSGLVYSIATVASATGYQWGVPAGATIVSGQGTAAITVDFADFTTGEISVMSFNDCGNSTMGEESVLGLEGAPRPSAERDIVVTGNTYTIAPIAGATNYTWDVPAGISIDQGQGSNAITISIETAFTEGTVCVTASNDCGIGQSICTDVPLQVHLSTCTAAYIGYEPARCVSLTPLVQGGTAPYTYNWSNGAATPTINVCPEETTVYQLTVTDANGLSVTHNTEVEVYDIRCGVYHTFVEVCRVSGLSSSRRSLCVTPSRVPYYLDNGGALGNCELLTCTGSANGLSADQSVSNFALMDEERNNLILFPNPADQQLTVQIQSQYEERAVLSILNTNGEALRQISITIDPGQNAFELPLHDLPAGIYFLQINGTNLLLQNKFIKL